MKLLLIVLLGISVAAGFDFNGLRVTFGPLKNIKEFFFKLPRTIADAEMEGWCKTERPPGPLKQLVLYCAPEKDICLLYDLSGRVAGLQIAFLADALSAAVIDIEKWFTKWTVAATDGEPAKEYWTITQYYVSEESLEENCGAQDADFSTLRDPGIWVYNHSGELMLIPRSEADIKSKTIFTKQNCTPRMGTHYHYNMTKEMLCENQLPWFALTMDEELIGSGLQFFGDLSKPLKYREWFEKFEGSAVERGAVPNGPKCLYINADLNTIFSLHIYFINDPENIKCRLEDSVDPSTIPQQ